jgi:hypothetical protein
LCVQSRVSKRTVHRPTNLLNQRQYKIRAVELAVLSVPGNKKPVMLVVSRIYSMWIYCFGTWVLFSWMRRGLHYAAMQTAGVQVLVFWLPADFNVQSSTDCTSVTDFAFRLHLHVDKFRPLPASSHATPFAFTLRTWLPPVMPSAARCALWSSASPVRRLRQGPSQAR